MLGLIGFAVLGNGMKDDQGLALVKEVIDGPGQRRLAALGEVQSHANLPIASHL